MNKLMAIFWKLTGPYIKCVPYDIGVKICKKDSLDGTTI